jgi:hypothetical protein
LLYFDYVIPLNAILESVIRSFPLKDKDFKPYPLDFLPPDLKNKDFEADLHDASVLLTYYLLLHSSEVAENKRMGVLAAMGVDVSSLDQKFSSGMRGFMAKYDLHATPIDIGCDPSSDESDIGDPVITLPSLDLIDTSRTSLEQIIEFRKDKKSWSQLRRLRSFVFENYAGKPRAYVEDDILKRLDDYQAAIKRWRFETVRATLNMVLTSKMLAGSMTGSFISSLIGAPVPAAIAAVGGLSLEIGKVVLELKTRKFELRNSLEDNPLSYIVTARTSLAPKAS